MVSKKLSVIAGPNGSGKSTVIESLIAQGALPKLYVSPDILVKNQDYSNIESEVDRYIAAMQDAEDFRKMLLRDGESFCFETVFSGTDKLKFMELAKSLDYHIEFIFVGTRSEYVNIKRVEKRVSEGGHDVPADKIVSRWKKSFANLLLAIPVADTILVFDNSEESPEIVASKMDGFVFVNDKFRDTNWQAVMDAMKQGS